MSLKAKLEAVIYAAEEPVTLAQLAVLFAADALEWKAEQEAVSAVQAADASAEAAQPRPAENPEFAYLEPEPGPLTPDAPAPFPLEGESVTEVQQEPSPAPEPETDPDSEATTEQEAEDEPEATEEVSAASEADARRRARLRDREVRAVIRQLLDEIITTYASDSRGVEIREIAGGYRMATKPECHDAVRAFVKSLKPALKLSLPALETLAVIAYKQPVTAPEVNEIRGVDSSAVFGSLLARKLITTAGRKPVIGRPILYKTTREFLLRFGLKDVTELPSMEEFEKMAAIELDEPELAAAAQPAQKASPDFDESGSAELEDSPSESDSADTAETTSTPQPIAVSPANPAASIPAEAAPAAPHSTEQAETEIFPDDQ
jgi:segregation and condensation protein B